MSKAARILNLEPQMALPGGEVLITCEGLDTSELSTTAVQIGNIPASLVASSPRRILAIVPELKQNGPAEVVIESRGLRTEAAELNVGKRLAEDLHPVANPAFDPDDGALFVTRSGSRGEHLPVTLFRIDLNGEVSEFSGDITNPTAIAFDRGGQMFVTSRFDGTVYRVTPFKEAIPFARNLGVATGLAFDRSDMMYVGDRTGTVFKVNSIGEETSWAQIEPSVSAYHLAVGPDDAVYVAGPTVASFDSIMRIDAEANISVFYKGLGRPQGMAFDHDGNLLVAASLRGRRGIIRISADGQAAEVLVAGINLVGLALSATGEMAIASTDSVYRLTP